MAMGGESVEARDMGGVETMKAEDGRRRPLVSADVLALGDSEADVELSLAKFAEVAASNPTDPPQIPVELDCVLREISTVGVPYYGWGGLKELIAARMAEAIGALQKDSGYVRASGGKDYAQRRDDLLGSLRSFDAAPFTLQRLAEVLQDPRRQYSSTHKLINGLERLLAVSSTLPTRSRKVALRPAPSTTSATAARDATIAPASNGAATAVPQDNNTAMSVAVKVEEPSPPPQSATNGASVDAALVPTKDEPSVREGVDGWEPEDSNGGRGPGRKRHKVGVQLGDPVMTE